HRRDYAGNRNRALRSCFRKDRVEHAGGGCARRQDHPGDRSARHKRGDRRIGRNAVFARYGFNSNASSLRDPGAIDCISYRRGNRHRCRPTPQPREICHGGINLSHESHRRRAGRGNGRGYGEGDNITNQLRRPYPQLLSHRFGRRRTIGNHCLAYLVYCRWVDNLVRPLIPPTYRPESYLPWPIPGTGLIIAFIALTLLGFLTANLVGRTLVELGESLLSRMPIVRPIYKTM